ncbi:MAG: hypothetical protein IPK04_15955 [Bdellovibrionales bacterium]|nr:hypothetical protein [Bdellovibrionales bacterium]
MIRLLARSIPAIKRFREFVGMEPIYIVGGVLESMAALNEACVLTGHDLLPNTVYEAPAKLAILRN